MLHRQSLESRVIEVKGNNYETSRLIYEFKPFIASVAQKKSGRFLEYGVDEELSIGLSAFKEAIDSFKKEKGKFLNFARLVINMRLIDYYRKTSKKRAFILESDNRYSANVKYNEMISMEQYQIDDERERRILEIIEYRVELGKWGISLETLADESPKNESLREQYKGVAKAIVKNSDILKAMISTKKLPLKKLENITGVHRKKLERGRIYIIAMVLAIIGNLSYIEV